MAAAENELDKLARLEEELGTQSLGSKVITKHSDLAGCKKALLASKELALDCEGVGLCRLGEVSLVQLATPSECFLFDVLKEKKPLFSAHVMLLKKVLESADCVKIIHDCKMDSDALFHLLDIKLTNCHDTQAWDSVLTSRRENLNSTLVNYNCTQNQARDSNIYIRNYRYWELRPLTAQMIEWASGDVSSLFSLKEAQVARASLSHSVLCRKETKRNLNYLRDKETQVYSVKLNLLIKSNFETS